MKILTICPSIYPNKYRQMIESFFKTKSDNNSIVVGSDKEKTVTQVFNETFQDHPDYDFYFMANDDIIFETKNWDMLLAKSGKISYGKDNIQNENLCTFPMIDGNIVRKLGWLQMPLLNKYGGDLVWKFIGSEIHCLNYDPSVMIRHNWEGADEEINKKDMGVFAEWLRTSYRDINKIKEIFNVNKN